MTKPSNAPAKADTGEGLAKRARRAATAGANLGKRHGKAAAEIAVGVGTAALKTKTGKRAAIGAGSGALVGAALPFVSAVACAALGAGAFVLWKGMKDKE